MEEKMEQGMEQKKVFMLCEEKEHGDAIREFRVLTVSSDRDALRQLLAAKVAKDEYGIIGSNGVRDVGSDYFASEYENESMVEYYILEEGVLTREQTLGLLQTEEYSTEFTYPDNMRQILKDSIACFADDHYIGLVDLEKAADAIMKDQGFKACIKKSWWANEHISIQHIERAALDCTYFLEDLLKASSNFFVEIGAVPEFNPPENLKDIIVDCIYDVSKSLHLPVNDPEEQAETIMRNSSFRDLMRKLFDGVKRLEPGTKEYLKAVVYCTHQARDYISYENPNLNQQQGKGAWLEDKVREAEAVQEGNAMKGEQSPDRDR